MFDASWATNITSLFVMNGHGAYVWGSLVLVFGIYAIGLVSAWRQRARVIHALRTRRQAS